MANRTAKPTANRTATAPRRTWRAAPATLAVVVLFCVAAGVCVPIMAYLVFLREQSPAVPIFLAVLAVVTLIYGWRFGLHPRLQAGPAGVTVRNPGRRARFAWSEITVLYPGENGLVVASEQESIEAWCVQKSRWAARGGRRTRADRITEELIALQEQHDPPLEDEQTGIRIRRARWTEHGTLTRLERSASKAALSHIFPPETYPYPTATVRRRWRRLLRDGRVQVRILDVYEEPIGFVAYEKAGRLRHLGIAPQEAGRGYGGLLLQFAAEEIFDSGSALAELWVLVENEGARAFYRSQGWQDTNERRDSPYPPYPRELKMVRFNPTPPRHEFDEDGGDDTVVGANR
jgi:ribosomal protein S18 acetylase RimI-like enzyme